MRQIGRGAHHGLMAAAFYLCHTKILNEDQEAAQVMNHEQLLQRIDTAWSALQASYRGLSDDQLTTPGVVEDWSIKDILAHITTWEEEALHHLPTVMAGQRPPRYAATGGIDAFNARKSEENWQRSLAEVLQRHEDVHQQIIAFVVATPEEFIRTDTRFRHRLRLETYGHYSLHTAAIEAWLAVEGEQGEKGEK